MADAPPSPPSLFIRAHQYAAARGRGAIITLIGGLAALWISEHYNAPAMLLALLLGLALHFLYEDERIAVGIDWGASVLLRIGVALLGLRIAVGDIAAAGWVAPAIVLAAMVASFAVGLIGHRSLGLSSAFGRLSAGAVAICGVSAAVAIAAVLPKRDDSNEALAVVVIAVTALSTLAMVLYPVLAGLFQLSDVAAGVFLGGSIHDVAQVIGAGYSVSETTGDTATYIKLMRVALLLPIVVLLSLSAQRTAPSPHASRLVPNFLIGFLVLAVLNSAGVVAAPLASLGNEVSRTLLVMAIFAIGVKSTLKSVMEVGPQPLILLCAETVAMAVVILIGVTLFMGN